MAHLAAAGKAETARLTYRIGREIIVKHKGGARFALQRVNDLFITAGAQRGHHQRLGFTAREQGAAMGPGQHAHLAGDRAHGAGVAAVNALSSF